VAGDSFWDSISRFWPSYPWIPRWCCKICKLGPITQLIDENYKGGVPEFHRGQRKYESHARSISKRVWKNPWVGNADRSFPYTGLGQPFSYLAFTFSGQKLLTTRLMRKGMTGWVAGSARLPLLPISSSSEESHPRTCKKAQFPSPCLCRKNWSLS